MDELLPHLEFSAAVRHLMVNQEEEGRPLLTCMENQYTSAMDFCLFPDTSEKKSNQELWQQLHLMPTF